MDIQTLSKVRTVIGAEITKYIHTNAGKLHVAPHTSVLSFANALMTEVTVALQKEIPFKSADTAAPVAKKVAVKTAVKVEDSQTTKRRGRPAKVQSLGVDAEVAAAPATAKIKNKSKSDKLKNNVLKANEIASDESEIDIEETLESVDDISF
jgi:hypothetical protein